jgi:hypothetical protein
MNQWVEGRMFEDMPVEEVILGSKEAALKAGISQVTVNRLARKGKIKSIRIRVRKQDEYRIQWSSLEKYLQEHPLKRLEILEPGQKRCVRCKKIKSLDDFHTHKKYSDGKQTTCIECKALLGEIRRREHPEKVRRVGLKHKYGLSMEEYQQMLRDQNGVCAICKRPQNRTHPTAGIHELCVDHCHTTGAIRGLLCHDCNSALGLLHDDPERAKALLQYIEERVLW